jgi:DNA-binding NarL/FixJ family response regulator
MSDPKKKPRIGPQQTNKYFHTLDTFLHLVKRTDPAIQENHTSTDRPANTLTGRRSGDRDFIDLYDRWLNLSPREQDVTFFTCIGYKNQQIAFTMGISVGTVKSYLQHVFYKVGVRSKTELRLKFFNFNFNRDLPHE